MDHFISIVTFGLKTGTNKLILLKLMRVNYFGCHFSLGKVFFSMFLTLTIEMTGIKLPSKVTQLNSLKMDKRMDLLVFTTQLNNMLLSIVYNGNPDSSQLVARTNILQFNTVTDC